MKCTNIVLCSLAVLLALPSAYAGRIGNRQANQRRRIEEGEQSGELTNKERKRANREQRHIEAEKKEARSDGVVTKQERREINHDQNKASADIYRMKHNDQVRGGAPVDGQPSAPGAPAAQAPAPAAGSVTSQ